MSIENIVGKGNKLEFSHAWRERYYAGEPLRIGNQVQLLFDDYMVEDSFGLKRVIGPIEEYSGNPLDTGPPLWEKDEISSFLEKEDDFNPETDYVGWVEAPFDDVIYDPDEDLYKAYYRGPFVYRENFRSRFSRSASYLESKDGINWQKPELDLFSFAGKKKTNIVLLAGREKGNATLGSVIFNPQAENPERRFFALAKTTPPGESADCIVKLFSADGKNGILLRIRSCSGAPMTADIILFAISSVTAGCCFDGRLPMP